MDLDFIGLSLTGEHFNTFRSAAFSGFLTLGGLMLTSLGLFTTRIHDFMVRPEFRDHFVDVEAVLPQTDHTRPLREMTQSVRRAALACLVIAGVEVLSGTFFPEQAVVPLGAVLFGLFYVGRVMNAMLKAYTEWLTEFGKAYKRSIAPAHRRAG